MQPIQTRKKLLETLLKIIVREVAFASDQERCSETEIQLINEEYQIDFRYMKPRPALKLVPDDEED